MKFKLYTKEKILITCMFATYCKSINVKVIDIFSFVQNLEHNISYFNNTHVS